VTTAADGDSSETPEGNERPSRWLAKPTTPHTHIPPEGIGPVRTGNAAIDWRTNSINEWYSRKAREEALLRPAWGLVRSARGLWWLSIEGALLRLLWIALMIFAILRFVPAPGDETFRLWGFVAVVVLAVLTPVVAFAVGGSHQSSHVRSGGRV